MFKTGLLLFKIVLISVCICPFIACSEEEPISLNKADLQLVDSLFQERKVDLVQLTDSLCNLKYDTYYNSAVDSIKKIRLSEIQFILGK